MPCRALLLSLLIAVTAASAWAGTSTFTTYYPAPQGEYDNLTVSGTLNVSGALTAANFSVAGNLGIGTAVPAQMLDVAGKIAVNGTPMLYLPDQSGSAFFGSMVIGDGGTQLLHTGSTEAYYNTFVGISAGQINTKGQSNTVVGYNAFNRNTTGFSNVALGVEALYANTTGMSNTAVGPGASRNNTEGYLNVASGTQALQRNTTGHHNTAYGAAAMETNTTGNYNLTIGAMTDVLSANLTNATAIGYNAKVGASNAMVLGGTGADAINVGIGLTAPSETLEVTGNVKINGKLTAGSILKGSVNIDGSRLAGAGFTSTKTATGKYTITFTSAFSSTPTVVANVIDSATSHTGYIVIGPVTASNCVINTLNGDSNSSDRPFNFIAME